MYLSSAILSLSALFSFMLAILSSISPWILEISALCAATAVGSVLLTAAVVLLTVSNLANMALNVASSSGFTSCALLAAIRSLANFMSSAVALVLLSRATSSRCCPILPLGFLKRFPNHIMKALPEMRIIPQPRGIKKGATKSTHSLFSHQVTKSVTILTIGPRISSTPSAAPSPSLKRPAKVAAKPAKRGPQKTKSTPAMSKPTQCLEKKPPIPPLR